MRKVTVMLGLLIVLGLGASAWALTASVGANFAGLNALDDAAVNGNLLFIPPDQGSAVGPSHYMEMINLSYAIYNKNGTTAVPHTSLNDFFANAGVTGLGTNLADPRLIYDKASSRWFATAITTSSNTNNFVVAVSQTSDPTGAWKARSFQANTTAFNFADYPTIAVDQNAFYIGSNNFQGTSPTSNASFVGVSLTTIPKTDLINPAGPIVANKTHFESLGGAGQGTAGTSPATLAPVSDFDGRGHGVVLATDDFFPVTILHRYSVTNPGSNASTLVPDSPITVPSFWNNQTAHQPDGTQTLDGVDFRIGANNVYQVSNVIWAAQSVLTTAATGNAVYDAIRWYEIDETTNSLLQSGTISDPHHDFLFPAIAANAAGDVVIGFTASGDSTTADFPGSWYVAGATVGGVTTFDAPALLKNGFGNYNITFPPEELRNRWGDFSAISVDPIDPNRFWIAEEVSIQGTATRPVLWGTQISEIVFAEPAVPEPITAGLSLMGLAGLALAATRRQR